MNKANTFYEIQDAVAFNNPIDEKNEFYTDFSAFRKDFSEDKIFKHFNINPVTKNCNKLSQTVKLFLSGHRGTGKTTELLKLKKPGDTIVSSAAGQPILVTKGKDDIIRGFFNTCRHRGARLLSKSGRYPVISCPYHRWGYALDGRLVATPITFPISLGPVAPVSAMIALSSATSSSSESCLGRYSSNTAASANSLSASSGRLLS